MVGYFARSIAGHDKGCVYLVIDENENRVTVCDGTYKTIASPKNKNVKHIQIIKKKIDEDVLKEVLQKSASADEKIKLAIKRITREDENV